MITDEQIKQLAVSCGFKLTNETGDDLKPYVYEFARELIALAQQVNSLEFRRDEDGDLIAVTIMGNFIIYTCDNAFDYRQREYATEAEAIEAANADYQRMVLLRLVHGGV